MANKYDLKSVFQSLTANTHDQVTIATVSTVSAVPTGKTRFLTYLRITRTAAPSAGSQITGLTGVIASVATASNLSSYASAVSSGGKLPVLLQRLITSACSGGSTAPPATVINVIPERPHMDHPIISVAGGSCMVFHVPAAGPAAQLFAQYYDE